MAATQGIPQYGDRGAWGTESYAVKHAKDIYDTGISPRYHWTGTQLDGVYVRRDGSLELTADWDAGAFRITADELEADTDILLGGVSINVGGTLSNVAYLDQDQIFTDKQTIQFSGTQLQLGDSATDYVTFQVAADGKLTLSLIHI